MNAEELRTKTPDELVKAVLDLRKAQLNQRFQKKQGALENTAEVRRNRRAIARAKTILNEKRRGEAAPAKEARASSKKKTA